MPDDNFTKQAHADALSIADKLHNSKDTPEKAAADLMMTEVRTAQQTYGLGSTGYKEYIKALTDDMTASRVLPQVSIGWAIQNEGTFGASDSVPIDLKLVSFDAALAKKNDDLLEFTLATAFGEQAPLIKSWANDTGDNTVNIADLATATSRYQEQAENFAGLSGLLKPVPGYDGKSIFDMISVYNQSKPPVKVLDYGTLNDVINNKMDNEPYKTMFATAGVTKDALKDLYANWTSPQQKLLMASGDDGTTWVGPFATYNDAITADSLARGSGFDSAVAMQAALAKGANTYQGSADLSVSQTKDLAADFAAEPSNSSFMRLLAPSGNNITKHSIDAANAAALTTQMTDVEHRILDKLNSSFDKLAPNGTLNVLDFEKAASTLVVPPAADNTTPAVVPPADGSVVPPASGLDYTVPIVRGSTPWQLATDALNKLHPGGKLTNADLVKACNVIMAHNGFAGSLVIDQRGHIGGVGNQSWVGLKGSVTIPGDLEAEMAALPQ
ncbi:hypothetical protein BH10CYA1_BH10CYA1_18330 [soil metagenome]